MAVKDDILGGTYQENVDKEVSIAAAFEEDTERREEDREAARWGNQLWHGRPRRERART